MSCRRRFAVPRLVRPDIRFAEINSSRRLTEIYEISLAQKNHRIFVHTQPQFSTVTAPTQVFSCAVSRLPEVPNFHFLDFVYICPSRYVSPAHNFVASPCGALRASCLREPVWYPAHLFVHFIRRALNSLLNNVRIFPHQSLMLNFFFLGAAELEWPPLTHGQEPHSLKSEIEWHTLMPGRY